MGARCNYNRNDNSTILFNEKYAGGVTPVVIANQITYHATEHWPSPSRFPRGYQVVIMSCDLSKMSSTEENVPLMNPKNWKIAVPLPFDMKWISKSFPNITKPGFLEGNIVIVP